MRPRPDHPMQFVLGLLIWFGWFVVIYAGVSIGCGAATAQTARGWFIGIGLGLGASTLAVVTYFCCAALACWRTARAGRAMCAGRRDSAAAAPAFEASGVANRRFIAASAAALHASAAVATVFVALVFIAVPLVPLPPCV